MSVQRRRTAAQSNRNHLIMSYQGKSKADLARQGKVLAQKYVLKYQRKQQPVTAREFYANQT